MSNDNLYIFCTKNHIQKDQHFYQKTQFIPNLIGLMCATHKPKSVIFLQKFLP